MAEVIYDPKTNSGKAEVIYDPDKNQNKEQPTNNQELKDTSVWVKSMLFFTLGLAILIDVIDFLGTALDLGTMGIAGWILRITFSIPKLFYLGFFWYLSKIFDYKSDRII
jgi:hypothetical protein